MKEIRAIIWDWNGTLLDDVDLGVEIINDSLTKRGLKTIDRAYYRQVFTFPVRDYYTKLGFDVEKDAVWEEVAMEFIQTYHEKLLTVPLFSDVRETLTYFKTHGYSQSILSAMEHNTLLKMANHFEITTCFDHIEGIENHYADGKLHKGKELAAKLSHKPENVLFIGDTLHDMEVAQDLGFNVVLVSRGHQARERLEKTGVKVFDSLKSMSANIL